MMKYISILILCILIIVAIYIILEYDNIPSDMVLIPSYNPPEPPQPIRPGIGDITITGPERKPLLFTIDLSSNSNSINWQKLMSSDPTATVTVYGYIDNNGKFYIKELDDAGHTNVGKIINEAMATWRYTFYKIGKIRFYFNLPSKEAKLIIDLSDIDRNPVIAEFIPIQNGKLYNIPELPPGLINYGSIN